jgi:hypothetical protein
MLQSLQLSSRPVFRSWTLPTFSLTDTRTYLNFNLLLIHSRIILKELVPTIPLLWGLSTLPKLCSISYTNWKWSVTMSSFNIWAHFVAGTVNIARRSHLFPPDRILKSRQFFPTGIFKLICTSSFSLSVQLFEKFKIRFLCAQITVFS